MDWPLLVGPDVHKAVAVARVNLVTILVIKEGGDVL